MRTIYLLDRNVVDLIKRYNAGKTFSDPNKIEMLRRLSEADNPNSLVSPILSMIEGQHGRQESKEEKKEILEKETAAVDFFFKSAKTDRQAMKETEDLFVKAFESVQEIDFDAAERFINKSTKLLIKSRKKSERKSIEKEILLNADVEKIPRSHPAVVLCLSTLYGCEGSTKVIKPSESGKAYNSLSDIYLIARMNVVRATLGILGVNDIQVKLLTLDKGLEKVLESISVSGIHFSTESGLLLQRISYKKKLFPHLNRKEYDSLMIEIKDKTPKK